VRRGGERQKSAHNEQRHFHAIHSMFTSTISSLSIANVINIVTRTALSITDKFAGERREGPC
jgi:hypothetical protein